MKTLRRKRRKVATPPKQPEPVGDNLFGLRYKNPDEYIHNEPDPSLRGVRTVYENDIVDR